MPSTTPVNPIGLLTEQDIERLAEGCVRDLFFEWLAPLRGGNPAAYGWLNKRRLALGHIVRASIRQQMEIETGKRLDAIKQPDVAALLQRIQVILNAPDPWDAMTADSIAALMVENGYPIQGFDAG